MQQLISQYKEEGHGLHLAILKKPYLSLILEGTKTIESRLGKRKLPPYEKVAKGDLILFKQSSGPIKGKAEVENVFFVENPNVNYLKWKYNDLICGANDYWEMKQSSRYASLILLTNVQKFVEPVYIQKSDGRAWVVMN